MCMSVSSTMICSAPYYLVTVELLLYFNLDIMTPTAASKSSRTASLTDLAKCKLSQLGTEYMGFTMTTAGGIRCQMWYSEKPIHKVSEAITDKDFPERSLQLARNYCRNPTKNPKGPWCYTMEPTLIDDACEVPLCNYGECRISGTGVEYGGTHDITSSDRKCKSWNKRLKLAVNKTEKFPNNHFPDLSRKKAKNFCRNPDSSTGGPWCYVDSHDYEIVEREYCSIAFCDDKDCLVYSKNASVYSILTSMNSTIGNITFWMKLWNPADEQAEARLLFSHLQVPTSAEVMAQEWRAGVEIVISNTGSGQAYPRTDEEPDFEETPNILVGSKWTAIWVSWGGGFISVGHHGKSKPIFLDEFKKKNTISSLYPESFFHYGIMGTGVLWSMQTCEEKCEIHTTFGLEFVRVWPMLQSNSSHDVQFYVRASHKAVIQLTQTPAVPFPCLLIVIGQADSTLLLYQEKETSSKKILLDLETKHILDFWTWREFTVSIFGMAIQLFWHRDYGREEVFSVEHVRVPTVRWFSIGSDHTIAQWTLFCAPEEANAVEAPWFPNCVSSTTDSRYEGSQWTTADQIPCIPWISNRIPEDYKKDDIFIDGSALKALNKCRNPTKDIKGPFCFTVSQSEGSAIKQYCPIRKCRSSECRMAGTANDYLGTLSVTRSGRKCAPWVSGYETVPVPTKNTSLDSLIAMALVTLKMNRENSLKYDMLDMPSEEWDIIGLRSQLLESKPELKHNQRRPRQHRSNPTSGNDSSEPHDHYYDNDLLGGEPPNETAWMQHMPTTHSEPPESSTQTQVNSQPTTKHHSSDSTSDDKHDDTLGPYEQHHDDDLFGREPPNETASTPHVLTTISQSPESSTLSQVNSQPMTQLPITKPHTSSSSTDEDHDDTSEPYGQYNDDLLDKKPPNKTTSMQHVPTTLSELPESSTLAQVNSEPTTQLPTNKQHRPDLLNSEPSDQTTRMQHVPTTHSESPESSTLAQVNSQLITQLPTTKQHRANPSTVEDHDDTSTETISMQHVPTTHFESPRSSTLTQDNSEPTTQLPTTKQHRPDLLNSKPPDETTRMQHVPTTNSESPESSTLAQVNSEPMTQLSTTKQHRANPSTVEDHDETSEPYGQYNDDLLDKKPPNKTTSMQHVPTTLSELPESSTLAQVNLGPTTQLPTNKQHRPDLLNSEPPDETTRMQHVPTTHSEPPSLPDIAQVDSRPTTPRPSSSHPSEILSSNKLSHATTPSGSTNGNERTTPIENKGPKPIHAVDPRYLNDTLYPEQSARNASNYCRNPSRNIAGTWCYTTDPQVPQDLCNVRDCEQPEECTFIVRGMGAGRRLYVLPEYRSDGLHFFLKEWEPDRPDSITFVILSEDGVGSRFFLKVGAVKNEKVLLFYETRDRGMRLVKEKTLPHLLYLGKWTGFRLRMERGGVKLYYEGAPYPLFEWVDPDPARAFLPVYYYYSSELNNAIGVAFKCDTKCHIEHTTTDRFTRILPISIWEKEETPSPQRLVLMLRGEGTVLLPLLMMPSTPGYYALVIGELKQWVYLIKNNRPMVHVLHKQDTKGPLFTQNTWTNITIQFQNYSMLVLRNNTEVLRYVHHSPFLFYFFSLSVDKGGWVTWTANCLPTDIDGAPLDGGWSKWGPWSCSASCDGGMGIRKRVCNNPEPNIRGQPCLGPSTMSGRCNMNKCGDISDVTLELIKRRIRTQHTSIVAKEGEGVTLSADAEIISALRNETPTSQINWSRNGIFLEQEEGRVKFEDTAVSISHAVVNDSGVYTQTLHRVDDSHLIFKVISLAIIPSTKTVVIRETLPFSVVCHCVVLGYVYSDLKVAWTLNGKVFKDYGVSTPIAVNVDHIPKTNGSHQGEWRCEVIQSDLNFKWTTNVITVRVMGPPNWRTHLMEDKVTRPIFGWMPNEGFVAFSAFFLTLLIILGIAVATVWYLRFRDSLKYKDPLQKKLGLSRRNKRFDESESEKLIDEEETAE